MSFIGAVVLGVAGGVLSFALMTATGRPRQLSRRVGLALLWLWACGVAGLTFGTPSGGGMAVNIAPLDVSNPADRVDFALNMIMFLPGGVLLVVIGLRWFQAAALGLLGSFGIEAMQFLTSSGRTADVNDLLANTLGCLVGAGVGVAATSVRRRSSAPVAGQPSSLA